MLHMTTLTMLIFPALKMLFYQMTLWEYSLLQVTSEALLICSHLLCTGILAAACEINFMT